MTPVKLSVIEAGLSEGKGMRSEVMVPLLAGHGGFAPAQTNGNVFPFPKKLMFTAAGGAPCYSPTAAENLSALGMSQV